MSAPRPYSPETLADRWGCSVDTVRTMCREGRLSSFRLGRLIRIPAAEVDRYECQSTDSSSIEGDSASPIATPNEVAFASRLVRQTAGLRNLALVKSGEPETDRRANG